MKTTDLNQKYVVNPAYKFRGDHSNIIITNNNSARYNSYALRNEITTSFAWCTHPDLAYLFSFFDGTRTLDEIAKHFSAYRNMDRQQLLDTVSSCLSNQEPVLIPAGEQHWVPIPKNFLIPATDGTVRDNLLGNIDLPFIRKFFNLTEVRLHVPNSMVLMLNTDCSTDCVYCYADKPKILQPLPFQRVKELIKEAYELDMAYLDLDGGDFFLYKHWREVLVEMLRYDYEPNISTKYPMTRPIVDELKKLGIRHIQLSIDSVNSQEMQRILNVDEQYTGRVLEGLRLLDEAGIEITIKPVITKYNDSEESVNNTIDTLTSFGNVRRILFTPAEFSQFKPLTYYSTRTQLTRLKTIVEQRNKVCAAELKFLGYREPKTVEQREREFPLRPLCTGNVHGFFVLPDGKVTLCEQLYWHPYFILGDLKKQSIMEVWNSRKAISLWEFSQERVRDSSPCKTCEAFDACRRGLGNCWRQAVAAYGSENFDYPAPNCPKAPPASNGFFIDC